MSGQGPPTNLTPQQQHIYLQQQQMLRQQQLQQQQQQMHQRQMQQQVQQPYQRARTPQMQQHPGGGSPGASHLQMHAHLQPPGHLQPRSPLVGAQLQAPSSVPPANPTTPQMMQQPMGMNQPMSLPPSHVSRPASVAPPSSVPTNLHSSGGGPPSNQMDQMGSQSQYPMHLQPQQTPSRPGSQQSQHISGGHGGPQSVQQPGSIQRPGSVLAPGSVQPPGSLGGPSSHSAVGGPQSVQGYGPGSVQPPGSAQAPSSVQPGSAFAPGSVQAPASQQPPASIQPPPSAASSSAVAAAASQNSKEPLKPNEEQIRMVQDPVDLVRNLVQKDLRNSLVEMNKRGAELVKQKVDGKVSEEDKAQYKRATNDFHAVCDEIDRTLTTVMETAKQLSKLDKVFMESSRKELDGEVMVNSVQSFVDSTEIVQVMFDETIGCVTASMEKMRRRQKKWEDQQKSQKNNEDVEMTE